MTKENLIDMMVNAYGFENEWTVKFAKEIENHPEWPWVRAFNVFETYCEYAEKEMKEEE